MAFQMPVDPREARRARNVGWATTILSGLLIGVIAYLAYAGFQGSDQLVHPGASRNCLLPSAMAWAYEAINYDQASDAALAAEPDPANCTANGAPAGPTLVTADGIRIAGWYIPAAAPIGPTGPTVVLIHGHASNKSGMLPEAAVLHEMYNLVLFDLRNHGQSSGSETTGGITERADLEAVVAWLNATHAPTAIGLLGSSLGGIIATRAVAAGLPVQALILDSTPASVADATRMHIEAMGLPLALPASWAVMLGTLFRTGIDVTAADPAITIDDVGRVPVLIIQGSADRAIAADSATIIARAATDGGVTVESDICDGGEHSRLTEACPDAYRTWVLGFLARTLGP
ncbi:MAG TPA: alpha/beta hydrolase [Candidatus Limnocylindria bacterium]|nr:alpha/beta hydrolase [Candidatus Limnocylindria bacterium]